jgi:tubulin---tyrosine ligase
MTTGPKVNYEKNINTDRLPMVKKKESYLKPRPQLLQNHFEINNSLFSIPSIKYFQDSLNTLLQPTGSTMDLEAHSSYVLIPSIQLKTTRKKFTNYSSTSTKNEPSSLNLQNMRIEGFSSPKHVKIVKNPESQSNPPALTLYKPKAAYKISSPKPVVYNESSLKEILYFNWINLIRSSCGFDAYPHKSQFKYYIGKGNNSSLINDILRSRFWWTRTDNYEDAHLVWTQSKHKPTLDLMPHYKSNLKIELNIPDSKLKIPQNILSENQETYGFKLILASDSYARLSVDYFLIPETLKAHNKLPNNSSMCNKKEMFKNMKKYYEKHELNVFKNLPLTFHIEYGLSDPQFELFLKQYQPRSTWIIKPGEATNRGKGIKVSDSLQEIKELINKPIENRTYILQQYIHNPLLINKRKFDIRCYALITTFANSLQAYFFKDGYLRTSCKEFTLKNTKDKYVHLTNDAIQKNHEDYGKFEAGNKLSYYDFQKFLSSNGSNKDFFDDIFPQMQEIVVDSIASTQDIVNSDLKLNSFEVLGYDFMVDSDYNVWLIEINTNPCLELSCSYLSKIIPEMIENSFRIALDPMFPPPQSNKKFKNWVKNSSLTNKYILVYSSLINN